MGGVDRLSSPGGRRIGERGLPLEKLADLAPCQDQIDKVVENQGATKYSKVAGGIRPSIGRLPGTHLW
jgi:hypothetical protein